MGPSFRSEHASGSVSTGTMSGVAGTRGCCLAIALSASTATALIGSQAQQCAEPPSGPKLPSRLV